MSGILSFSGNVSSDPRMKYDSELREMTILIKDIIKDKSVIAFGGCESMYKF